jgi:hypothetical protein
MTRVLELDMKARELKLSSVVTNSISTDNHKRHLRNSAVEDKVLEKRSFTELHSFSLPRSDDKRIQIRSQKAAQKTLDVTFMADIDAELFIKLFTGKNVLPPEAKGVELASRVRQASLVLEEEIGRSLVTAGHSPHPSAPSVMVANIRPWQYPDSDASSWLPTRSNEPTHFLTVSPNFATHPGNRSINEYKIQIRKLEEGKHSILCPPGSRTPNYSPQQLQHIHREEHRVPFFMIRKTEAEMAKSKRKQEREKVMRGKGKDCDRDGHQQFKDNSVAADADEEEVEGEAPQLLQVPLPLFRSCVLPTPPRGDDGPSPHLANGGNTEINAYAHLHVCTHLNRPEDVHQAQIFKEKKVMC